VFTYLGRSRIVLDRRDPEQQTSAVLWQDNPRGGGQQRNFYVRPVAVNRYHLRIIVGNVVTTDREGVGRKEVIAAARLMGFDVGDNQWSEVDRLLS
jgi:hypothetical protein